MSERDVYYFRRFVYEGREFPVAFFYFFHCYVLLHHLYQIHDGLIGEKVTLILS